jgi:hypothetical protein
MALFYIYWTFVALCCAYVFRRGDATERCAILIVTFGSLLTLLAWALLQRRYEQVEWGIFAVDIGVFLALVALAVRTPRHWPIWAASFHLVGLMTHVAKWVLPQILARAYSLVEGFWAYPMLILIVAATMARRRREASGCSTSS